MSKTLIIPDLPYMNKSVRSNINCLFLAPSGAGKTTLSKLFGEITLAPLEVESITPARLESEISKNPKFSLIVGDFARMSRDPIIIKIVEGILGEEKQAKRKTMVTDIDVQTEGIGLICGTPQDLSAYLSGGILFRLIPIIIIHKPEEHAEIGEKIADRIGNEDYSDISERTIKFFYKELELIQEGQHPNIKPIEGYIIEKRFSDLAKQEWKRITDGIVKETNMNFIRGLHEFFRILISHAFLNIFNRKIINNRLCPNEEDFTIALKIMIRTIETQYDILRTDRFIKSLRNLDELQRVMKNPAFKQKYKDYIKNMIKVKAGRVSVNG